MVILLTAQFFLVGCSKESSSQSQAVAPRKIVALQLEAMDVPADFEFIGRTASSQRVEVRSRIAGFLDKITYTEGAYVHKEDVLFKIDHAPLEASLRAAKAQLAQQQARLDNAQALLARIEPLVEEEAVSKKDFDDAKGSVLEAQAAVEGASAQVFQAELQLGYATIKSPVDGQTSSATQREGAYLDQTTPPLTYVVKIDPIWVEFSVAEMEVLKGRSAEKKHELVFPEDQEFVVSLELADGTQYPHVGQISFADASVNEQTGTFLMRAELPNPELLLRPGQYVRIKLRGAYRPDVIAVPQRAVFQGSKSAYVWLVGTDNKAEQRPVVLGPWVKDYWLVNQGLKAGDRLIVDGTVGLMPGYPVSIESISPLAEIGEAQ